MHLLSNQPFVIVDPRSCGTVIIIITIMLLFAGIVKQLCIIVNLLVNIVLLKR